MDQQTPLAVALYTFVGAVIFLALGVREIEKSHRAAAKAPISIPVRSTFAWLHCPNGHCKVLANRDWSCPICDAQLASVKDAALWSALEAA